jgi:hypothetical protein
MPPYATRRSLRCSRESLRCFFACRLCYVSRDKHYRMFPSQTMIISIRIPDTRCLISTCKIPANLPYNPRLGAPRWPREPRRKTRESSRTFSLRSSEAWLGVAVQFVRKPTISSVRNINTPDSIGFRGWWKTCVSKRMIPPLALYCVWSKQHCMGSQRHGTIPRKEYLCAVR